MAGQGFVRLVFRIMQFIIGTQFILAPFVKALSPFGYNLFKIKQKSETIVLLHYSIAPLLQYSTEIYKPRLIPTQNHILLTRRCRHE
jgi:hypothetical protein